MWLRRDPILSRFALGGRIRIFYSWLYLQIAEFDHSVPQKDGEDKLTAKGGAQDARSGY